MFKVKKKSYHHQILIRFKEVNYVSYCQIKTNLGTYVFGMLEFYHWRLGSTEKRYLFFLLNSLGRETLPIYTVFDYYMATVYDFHTHFQKRLKYESRPTNGGIW